MPVSRPRFTAMLLCAAAAAIVVGGNAIAHPAGVAPTVAEQSPFIGEWELDLARMPDTYGPPPKQVTYTFEDLGSGNWTTKVNIVGRDGSVRLATTQYRRDGRAVPVQGDLAEADRAAFHSPAPNVLVLSMAKAKAPAGVRIYAISADGREMTESAANLDRDGVPFVRNFHFRRIGN